MLGNDCSDQGRRRAVNGIEFGDLGERLGRKGLDETLTRRNN